MTPPAPQDRAPSVALQIEVVEIAAGRADTYEDSLALEAAAATLRECRPREATEAMVARAFESRPDLPLSQWLNNGIMRGLWRAMYDAYTRDGAERGKS